MTCKYYLQFEIAEAVRFFMKSLAVKYWFMAGIGLVVALGLTFPDASHVLKEYSIPTIGIFLSFFLTSLTLNTRSIAAEVRNFKGIIAALLSCFVLFPLGALAIGAFGFAEDRDMVVGLCILGTVPVTMATGTVMTALAKGNVSFSLTINVVTHCVGVFSIPFSIMFLLGSDSQIDLPVAKMMFKIALMVLLPVVLGQGLRPWVANRVAPLKKSFSIFNQSVVLLIILAGISSSASQLTESGIKIVTIALAMLLFHILILVMNYRISKLLKFDKPTTTAFTLHVSQKTLGFAFIVWSGFFITQFPMALIPAICYHLIQLIGDSALAQHWAEKSQRSKS